MKNISVTSSFSVYESLEELSPEVKDLMIQAIEIRKKAYAPYSRFRVGAAILLDNGKVVLGSNQENAAYPSGLCAERVAIFQAGAIYPDAKILKMAISATADDKEMTEPIPPCGACRQSIAEYEFRQDLPIEIYFMAAVGKVYKSDSLRNLLPLMFDKNFL
ncbi:cytidine deaminase [Flavobacterium cauense R2A-7]|uniref:Cytidine deaminase n=1 Tax=Flavobacterium cauense R2A-7 TaxID=1341154 RepID=V6S2M8_9FLAO|nr:cytidine deaminase [Flavobacterium cauense]ESU20923.1 cytidine deaminase [Flavobacterium cauense R2A-7]KGO82711.1 cytidine deaminase [Flavobacterium cauense R2A-7]TWI12268.1 cytidine deaminase [Flavobacterium cauense R2A-7]